jgi:hypothetical protein
MRWWNASHSKASFESDPALTDYRDIAGWQASRLHEQNASHNPPESTMLIRTRQARLPLTPRQLVRLDGACNTRLTAREGSAWITVDDGAGRDIVLGAGEAFVVDSNATVIVCAMGTGPALDLEIDTVLRPGRRCARALGGWAARLRGALLAAVRPQVSAA